MNQAAKNYLLKRGCKKVVILATSDIEFYKNLGFDIADYPNAYAQFANEISLPLHTCLTDEQIEYVIENYTDILKEYLA